MAGRPRAALAAVDPLVDAILNRRRTLGLTQAEVSRRRGLPANAQYQSNVETGRLAPTLPTLRSIADALDCDLTLAPRRHDDEAALAAALRALIQKYGQTVALRVPIEDLVDALADYAARLR